MRVPGYFLYNLVLGLWIGGMAIFSFVLTPVIFRSYGRDTAGEIVGRLFPYYFPYNLALSIAALALLLVFSADRTSLGYKLSLALVAAAIAVNVFVSFKLHPEARRVKREIHSFESVPPESPLRRRFSRLHGVSMALNLLVLADGVALLLISSSLKK
jgi:uncharacterized membrane protein